LVHTHVKVDGENVDVKPVGVHEAQPLLDYNTVEPGQIHLLNMAEYVKFVFVHVQDEFPMLVEPLGQAKH
jgi:hypothetical protein